MTVTVVSLADLPERDRERAWSRYRVIKPAVEDGVPLTRAAAVADVPVSTAHRWLAAYRVEGLVGLAPRSRSDRGQRRTQPELVALIEAMALAKPRPSAATITRRVCRLAAERGWPMPAYSTVAAIVAGLDPGWRLRGSRGAAENRRRSPRRGRLQGVHQLHRRQRDHDGKGLSSDQPSRQQVGR
jgi:putative transposase